MQTAWRRVGLLLAILVACTSSESDRFRAVAFVDSPAPRDCPTGIVRASSLPVSSLPEAADGHVPTWLPPGFGLLETFGPPSAFGDDFDALVVWTDGRCREVWLYYWSKAEGDAELPPGLPGVGAWTVTDYARHQCGNGVLGNASCLRYDAALGSGGRLHIFAMGLTRREGDAIVRSVPTA